MISMHIMMLRLSILVFVVLLFSCEHEKQSRSVEVELLKVDRVVANAPDRVVANAPDRVIKRIKNCPELKFNIDTFDVVTNRTLASMISGLKKDSLIESSYYKDVPLVVRCFLDSLEYPQVFDIADKGKLFNVSDAVMDEKLPWRQLQYLGVGKSYVLLSYYHGGIGKSSNVILIKHIDNRIENFWCGYVNVDISKKRSIMELLIIKASQANKFSPNEFYF